MPPSASHPRRCAAACPRHRAPAARLSRARPTCDQPPCTGGVQCLRRTPAPAGLVSPPWAGRTLPLQKGRVRAFGSSGAPALRGWVSCQQPVRSTARSWPREKAGKSTRADAPSPPLPQCPRRWRRREPGLLPLGWRFQWLEVLLRRGMHLGTRGSTTRATSTTKTTQRCPCPAPVYFSPAGKPRLPMLATGVRAGLFHWHQHRHQLLRTPPHALPPRGDASGSDGARAAPLWRTRPRRRPGRVAVVRLSGRGGRRG